MKQFASHKLSKPSICAAVWMQSRHLRVLISLLRNCNSCVALSVRQRNLVLDPLLQHMYQNVIAVYNDCLWNQWETLILLVVVTELVLNWHAAKIQEALNLLFLLCKEWTNCFWCFHGIESKPRKNSFILHPDELSSWCEVIVITGDNFLEVCSRTTEISSSARWQDQNRFTIKSIGANAIRHLCHPGMIYSSITSLLQGMEKNTI